MHFYRYDLRDALLVCTNFLYWRFSDVIGIRSLRVNDPGGVPGQQRVNHRGA